jgi:hypothetical protein
MGKGVFNDFNGFGLSDRRVWDGVSNVFCTDAFGAQLDIVLWTPIL